MSKTVLIVIDNAKRELFGCLLLKRYLGSVNIRSILCSRFTFYDYYARYIPDAVVYPNAFMNFADIAEHSCVFVLPSESGNGQADQIAATHGGTLVNATYPTCVDRFFCWGPAMKEILVETDKWREDQLAVTGSPSTDHWLLPSRSTELEHTSAGLTTTFRVLSGNARPSKVDYFRWLDRAELLGGDGTYYRPPEHAESWLFLEASLARVMAGLIRVLTVEGTETLKIRPHPLEWEGRYKYFQTISDRRVLVEKKGTISEWLEHISVLFTFISASALDALIRGVPVVSLGGLIDRDALRKIPNDFHYPYEDMMWQLEDISQATDYVQAAARGELALCRDEKQFYEFLTQHFLFPRKYAAAQQVALEIKKMLDGESRKKTGTSLSGRGIRQMVQQYLPMFPQLQAIRQYINGLRPGQLHIGFTYHLWRLWERNAVIRTVDKVWSSIGWQEVEPTETSSLSQSS